MSKERKRGRQGRGKEGTSVEHTAAVAFALMWRHRIDPTSLDLRKRDVLLPQTLYTSLSDFILLAHMY